MTVKDTKSGGEAPTRAFVHISNEGYTPINVVLKSADKTEALKQAALRELLSFQQKYRTISELAPVLNPVFEAIEKAERKLKPRKSDRESAAL